MKTDWSIIDAPLAQIQETGVAAPKSLMDSMATSGQFYPVILQRDEDTFVIEDGTRRVASARALGWETIKAMVHSIETDLVGAHVMLGSNIHSKNPLGEAMAFRALGGDTATAPGWTKGQRNARLKLLNLAPDFQQMLSADIITLSTAQQLSKLAHNDQFRAWKLATANAAEHNKGRVTSRLLNDAARHVLGESSGQQALRMPELSTDNTTVSAESDNANLACRLRELAVEHPESAAELMGTADLVDML